MDRLSKLNRPEVAVHSRSFRPWGWFRRISQGGRFQVKHLSIKPGASLSLRLHQHRAEHWVVVRGVAKVTRGENVTLLRENQSIYIPQGEVHRLENPGRTELEVIEVQSGAYLGEDDIVRLDNEYRRD